MKKYISYVLLLAVILPIAFVICKCEQFTGVFYDKGAYAIAENFIGTELKFMKKERELEHIHEERFDKSDYIVIKRNEQLITE